MKNENTKKSKVPSCENDKIELPKDVQKRMLEFFLKTSIPRKKAMTKNSLSNTKKTGEMKK